MFVFKKNSLTEKETTLIIKLFTLSTTVCVQIFSGRKFRDFHESAWVHENKNAKISPYLGLSSVMQNAREDD